MVDDVNMPNPDAYGTQGSIELLRQLVEYHGFYDRVTTQWKGVEDTSLLCAAAPASGGRHPMSPRFTWHLSTLCMPAPTHRTLSAVMTAFLLVRWGWLVVVLVLSLQLMVLVVLGVAVVSVGC